MQKHPLRTIYTLYAALLFSILMLYQTNVWALPGLELAELIKQTALLTQQLAELKDEVEQGAKTISDIEGKYGYGTLLDDPADFIKRQWAPDTWGDALDNPSNGSSSRYQALYQSYKKEHYTLSEKQYSNGASHSLAENYQGMAKSNQAAGTASNYEYELIKEHLDHVHQLTKSIESTNNIKAAMDLNSRLIAELSYISAEELRMQTLTNLQLAQEGSERISARTREAIFNQLPTDHA